MGYPNINAVTEEELKKFYPFGVFSFCPKCGATWPENAIFAHECGDTVTPIKDAIFRSILAD